MLSGEPAFSVESPEYAHRILAEGDSWFSVGAIPASNLLYELRFAKPTILLSLANPGDTIRNMSDIAGNDALRRLLVDRKMRTAWSAILLSGGGNDLIDRANALIRRPAGVGTDPADYVDPAALASLVADVQQGYRTIAALRDHPDSLCQGAPIVTHRYDYPTPRPSPAQFIGVPVKGPWLYPAFERLQIGRDDVRREVSDFLLDRLGDAIAALEAEIPNFHVVETRNTLVRAAPDATLTSGDWQNEIHPSVSGYRKLAALVAPALEAVFA